MFYKSLFMLQMYLQRNKKELRNVRKNNNQEFQ